MNDNTTSLGQNSHNIVSFKPIKRKEPMEDGKRVIDVTEEERRDDLLETLDKLRNMVANGHMDDVVIVARNLDNGFFFTEMAIRKSTYQSPEIGTVGAVLKALSLECSDCLMMAPYTDIDGVVFDPNYNANANNQGGNYE